MKKIIIIISSLLFVSLSALEIYVQSDVFARKLRPFVVEPLGAALGPGARIGWVKANLIPLFVEVRDISIPDARGREAIAIRKIKVYLNPLSLLFKNVSLSTISVLEPKILAERSEDGALSFARTMENIRSYLEETRKKGPSRYTVSLRTVSIRKGSFSFIDAKTASQASASEVNITARVSLPDDSVRFSVKAPAVLLKSGTYPGQTFNLKTDGVYDRGRLRIGAFELSTPDARLAAEGTIGAFPAADLNLRFTCRFGPRTMGQFSELLKPARKQKGPWMEASFTVSGKASDPVVEGKLRTAGVSLKGTAIQDATLGFRYRDKSFSINGEQLKLSKEGKSAVVDRIDIALGHSEAGLDINNFEFTAGDLRLRISGRLDPAKGLEAAVVAESSGRGQTLSFLTGMPFYGKLGVSGRLTGPLADPRFDGTFSAGPVTVRGLEFDDARGRLQYGDKIVTLSETSIHQRDSSYVFAGSVDLGGQEPFYTADLQVLHSDVVSIVAMFYQPLPLQLSAVGELSFKGSGSDFSGTGRLALEAGSAYGESFDKGSIAVTLVKDRITFNQVSLYKGSGVVKATGWIGFNGEYSSELTARYVRLSEVNHMPPTPIDGQFKLDMSSWGSFSHPRVKASFGMEDLTYDKTSVGGFQADAEINNAVMTFQAGLVDSRASLRGTLALRAPYAWNADMSVNSDRIDPFLLLGNRELKSRMQLIADGAITARGLGVDPASMSVAVSFRHLGMVIGDYRIDNEEDAVVTIAKNRLTVQALRFSGPGTRIAVTGGALLMQDMDFTFTGTANLSLLRILYREVEHADGVAEVKLSVRDEWKNPVVAGELDIRNGEVKIKDIPQKFSALNGRVRFDQNRIVVDALQGEIGGGKMGVSGWAQLTGLALHDFSARASFENVTVRYPEGLSSTLSGELFYDGDADEQNLSGDVMIRRARYDKRVEWKSMLVDLGRGFYQKKKTDIGWIGNTQVNIRFHGTDNIVFQNNLAKMPLNVDVFIRGTVNQPQLLGRIEAPKGSVYFRKNDFKILHASADFVDPNRMNPLLDIQAEIRVREYQIRLAVSGSADHAVVTLISDPSLPDQDILGLLALGKKSDELKGKETWVGMSEAASLATGQFQDIFERRARSLTGLDRVQVDPYVSKGDTSVPRVTVSKELVQDILYVTYSSNVGAAIPEQDFRIEYILDKHLSLVGERNEIGNIGGDVKVRFEFK